MVHNDGGQMPHRHRHMACTLSCLLFDHGSETDRTSHNYQHEDILILLSVIIDECTLQHYLKNFQLHLQLGINT